MSAFTADADRTLARNDSPPSIGAAIGGPKLILRLEGAVVLAAAVAAYAQAGAGWLTFALLILVPDLSMLGYLGGRRLGALTYNLGHSYVLPIGLGAFGALQGQPLALSLSLIWIAHIGFDRMLGYGLKYATAFGDTHLSRAGKRA